ncbi:M81 family metallopeptidase [Haloplanus aerogenes]|uniref:M81 family peptidase n=1 Tax=Haloplanus aerogenes TaxID=660522 RepID=A0A3M0D1E3_9EURY|nr:M81 family metallopeptidase [Haloplanus aerogenes]AZH23911.1 M81 family peptidase [Haloplanus aerogenes]RMB13329.1 microcystin degradation protein MlrC [Haloplanus aerogenes]
MSETVLVGQIEHETNTFSALPTGMTEFADASLHYGDDVIDDLQGTNTAVGGFLRVADEADWDVVPTVAADATPGGTVTADARETLLEAVLEGIEDSDPDGVLLALHGAMVSEAAPDGDGYILERVRRAVGPDVPVMASLDLHANISERMATHADGLFGYDTYPHVDIGDTGETAARAMAATLRGDLDPEVIVERAPLLPPLPELRTETEPMASLLASSADAEGEEVPDVSVFGGFAYADVDHAGFSVVGVADRSVADDARATCRALADEAVDRRGEFDRDYTSVDDAAAEAAAWDDDAPLLLADISDNPGGGSAQDGVVLLRALLDAGVEDAALATIYDPEAVEAAVDAGIGEEVSLALGGRSGENGDPLDVTGRVRLLSDGDYRNQGPMSTGLAVSFGRTALLDVDGIDVLVGSHRQQPYDPEAFRSQGITPERRRVLVLKSTVHYRAGFEPFVGGVREVATPGLCSPDLSAFDYDHVPRPIYPLDEV